MNWRKRLNWIAVLGALALLAAAAPGAQAMSYGDLEQDPNEEFMFCSAQTGYRNCVGGNSETCDLWLRLQGFYVCYDEQ